MHPLQGAWEVPDVGQQHQPDGPPGQRFRPPAPYEAALKDACAGRGLDALRAKVARSVASLRALTHTSNPRSKAQLKGRTPTSPRARRCRWRACERRWRLCPATRASSAPTAPNSPTPRRTPSAPWKPPPPPPAPPPPQPSRPRCRGSAPPRRRQRKRRRRRTWRGCGSSTGRRSWWRRWRGTPKPPRCWRTCATCGRARTWTIWWPRCRQGSTPTSTRVDCAP
jgi:hypothetical protein